MYAGSSRRAAAQVASLTVPSWRGRWTGQERRWARQWMNGAGATLRLGDERRHLIKVENPLKRAADEASAEWSNPPAEKSRTPDLMIDPALDILSAWTASNDTTSSRVELPAGAPAGRIEPHRTAAPRGSSSIWTELSRHQSSVARLLSSGASKVSGYSVCSHHRSYFVKRAGCTFSPCLFVVVGHASNKRALANKAPMRMTRVVVTRRPVEPPLRPHFLPSDAAGMYAIRLVPVAGESATESSRGTARSAERAAGHRTMGLQRLGRVLHHWETSLNR